MSEIERLGVVGAGFMGSGIAESCARAGLQVVIHEPEGPPLERSRAGIEKSIARAVSRGRMSQEDGEALIGRVSWTTELEDLRQVDAVVEAIIEDAKVKGSLFKKLDALLPDAKFLASNTSSIPIAEIASWTQRPERVVGLHFFSPVPVMNLVEIVVGYDTHDDDVTLAESLSKDIGKHPGHHQGPLRVHRQLPPRPLPDVRDPDVPGRLRQP